MAKLILSDVGSLVNHESAREAINNNFTEIEQVVDTLLSTTGAVPNQMTADLDMNSKKIMNVADAVTDGEAVNVRTARKIAADAGSGDTAIRQDLAQDGAGKGTTLVAYTPPSTGVLGTVKGFLDALWAAGASAGASLIAFTKEDGSTTTVKANSREKLTAARTYYVRTDGNNANTGLDNTAGGAWLTLQKAVDHIRDKLDLNGFDVTVQVADGTYAAGVLISQPWVGKGQVYFTGNTVTPASCIINANGDCFSAEKGTNIDVRGFRVVSATSRGIVAQTGSFISVGPMEFGAVGGAHIEVGTGGQILLGSDYTITGGGSSHLHAASEGQIFTAVITVTLTGTPAFSAYFAGAAQGSIIVKNVTYSGAATGARYLAHKGGVIETHPGVAPALPGSIEGRVWGGVYVGSTSVPLALQANPAAASAIVMQGFRGISQSFITHFECVSDGGGESFGRFFCNSESWNTGRTTFGTNTPVVTSSGTNDGFTINANTGEVNASRSADACGYFRRRTSDGTVLGFYRDTTFSGHISVTAGATAYNTSSDERIKNWQGPIQYDVTWLPRITAELGEFTYKADESGNVWTGVRAQRLADIEPNAVTVGEGAPGDEKFIPWGVDYSKLIPKLLLEVAVLRDRVTANEAEIARLNQLVAGTNP